MASTSKEKLGDVYLGIMTGTSLDAIDVAACRFVRGSIELLTFHSEKWPDGLRGLLYELATAKNVELDKLARVHFLLARQYAEAIEATLAEKGLNSSNIGAIGLHGQTVRHLPTSEPPAPGLPAVGATLQIGSGPALAAITGIDVVSDFRSADVALGGQGAPLVPMFDYYFLRSEQTDRLIVNIGGIANVTWLPRNAKSNDVIAFDSGPGNMLIDSLMRKYFDRPFDERGEIARSGKIDEDLLATLLSHPYFSTSPPKSTGRELFSEEFLSVVHRMISESVLSTHDAVATITELTGMSIAGSLRFVKAEQRDIEIVVSGGGAYNEYMMERIALHAAPARVHSSDAFGIPANTKEAIAFAFFAKAFVEEIRIHLPATTGARHATLLGSLSRGSKISSS